MAMKLYVVGEDSPDPDDWSIWSEWSLVIAGSEAEALSMARVESNSSEKISEVPMTKPLHIVKMSEPNHGEDI